MPTKLLRAVTQWGSKGKQEHQLSTGDKKTKGCTEGSEVEKKHTLGGHQAEHRRQDPEKSRHFRGDMKG